MIGRYFICFHTDHLDISVLSYNSIYDLCLVILDSAVTHSIDALCI